jgi:hypothetical protein
MESNVKGWEMRLKTHAPPSRKYTAGGSSQTTFPDHAVYGDPDYPWEAYITP